jgi:hypothetical protein
LKVPNNKAVNPKPLEWFLKLERRSAVRVTAVVSLTQTFHGQISLLPLQVASRSTPFSATDETIERHHARKSSNNKIHRSCGRMFSTLDTGLAATR